MTLQTVAVVDGQPLAYINHSAYPDREVTVHWTGSAQYLPMTSKHRSMFEARRAVERRFRELHATATTTLTMY